MLALFISFKLAFLQIKYINLSLYLLRSDWSLHVSWNHRCEEPGRVQISALWQILASAARWLGLPPSYFQHHVASFVSYIMFNHKKGQPFISFWSWVDNMYSRHSSEPYLGNVILWLQRSPLHECPWLSHVCFKTQISIGREKHELCLSDQSCDNSLPGSYQGNTRIFLNRNVIVSVACLTWHT